MTKNFLQDIVPPKRSIRNVPLPTSRKRIPTVVTEEPEEKELENDFQIRTETQPPVPPTPPRPPVSKPDELYRKKKSLKPMLMAAGTLGVIIFIFIILSLFSGAKVSIVPKQSEANVSEQLSASNMESASDGAGLVYKVTTLSEEVSTEVKATGEETVQTKASGIITVYNDYTENGQPLVKNTRFQAEDGRIYRIDKSITVPGKKGSTPGSIDVEVFADGFGDSYNAESAKFTIPGFEGQPQFDKFYAETKTSITGGFDGVRKVVSESDLASASESLNTKLVENLKNKVSSEINSETVVVFDDRLITVGSLEQKESGRDTVNLILKGTLQVLVFNKSDFNKNLAGESLTIFNPEDNVFILDESTLKVALSPEFDPAMGLDAAAVSVSGPVTFVWKTDQDLLKQKLAGKSKKELKSILQEFSSIAKAEATISPFWKTKFPENVSKISIEETITAPAQ